LQPRPATQPVGGAFYGDVKLRGRDLRLVQLGQDCGSGVCQVLVAETQHKRSALQSQIGGLVMLNGGGLAVLLAACAPLAPQPAPDAGLPPRFAGDAAQAGIGTPAWRDYFSDPALQAQIEQALAHNRDRAPALA
ncbi:sensor histidine kinase N-terminal domain-containing protein, partial [Escherichia coli]|uniref:sensor histidine kinase N-terminal domain-containing protein n=1 Tax=Escherichia coli TaxID=562 RepID=UPI00192A1CD4